MADSQERSPEIGGTLSRFGRSKAGKGSALLGLAMSAVMGSAPLVGTANASSVPSAAFSGGAGTVTVNGTVVAKQGGALKLTVNTAADAKCVQVTGAHTARQTSGTATAGPWTFDFTAGSGDGDRSLTITASTNFNAHGCTAQSSSTQGSYKVDNTGPVVSAALSPAANTAGWNNANTKLSWTATDAGAGVSATQPFASESITANGIHDKTAPAQSDRLGNTGSPGSATVRVDKVAPNVTATQTKNTDNTTTVTFRCTDDHSGVVTGTCVVEGTTSNSITVSGNRTVYGIATDSAGHTTRTPVEVVNSDTTAPHLSGAPQGTPSADGWYKDDVTVKWTASDPESGIPTPPADTRITGEGENLTSTTTVKNGDGLETTATSSPAVKIDRTAPTTAIRGTSNSWVNGTVNVTLAPSDNLSGVRSTTYAINGGAAQTGTSFSLTDEGTHTVTYSSTDKAGNVEATNTAEIKIDKTAPAIGHTFTPSTYVGGAWTNQNVTVTFKATDTGSGIASVTAPVEKSAEGANQRVVGTATDNAGNSATDTATVSIDKTEPLITATVDRAANGAGWYDDDVTVSYSASDALSGIASKSDETVLREGANQSASGTATDRAGNSQTAGVNGINVDKTVPDLTGSAPAGWHKGDVTVTWQASDPLSGLAGAVPAPSTVTGEGANLSATQTVLDKAGNAKTTTVSGIKIDRTKPTTVASVPQVPASGWYRSGVPVTLAGSDNLSGATTYYKVNGGAQQTYSGQPFTVSTPGTNTVTFWSVDGAGNIEEAPAPLTLKVDGDAPTTDVILPPAPDSGWYITGGLPVAFSAADGANGSGIAATYYQIDGGEQRTYGQPFTEQLSTGEHTITFWSVDIAGNVEAKETIMQTVNVKVDTTPPTITGATVNADGTPRAANGHGWFNSNVDVKFTCADVGSGVQTGMAGCAGDTTVVNESETQTVRGDAVDVAGNRSFTEFGPVKLDKTAPTLTGALPTTDRTASGWYKAPVTVIWTGDDQLSGIDPATQPADSTISGQGDNLGATASIKDKAGNTGSGAVTGIKIDTTKPVVGGAIVNDDGTARTANAAGWFNSSVRVRYSATDNLSGVQEKSGDEVLSEDGANQSATGSASDYADNTASTTVSGINVDSKAPTSTANIQCEGKNNFCRGAKATIALSAVDQPGLSGVKDMTYSTDAGKTWTTLAGDKGSFDITLNRSGKVSVQFKAADRAGNAETVNTIEVKYDTVAPTVSHKLDPEANAAGWNNADTTVTFSAEDKDVDASGVDIATLTKPVTLTTETAGQVVKGEAYDLAGNKGTDEVTVKLDKTAPGNTAAIKSGTKGANGWYTGPVTVGFTATDAVSGVATTPADVVLNSDRANQKASGTAVDTADNKKVATLDGINIDSVKPVIKVEGLKVSYTLGEATGITCTATDDTSGVDANGCTVTTSGGTANGVGTITYTATATDNAGNVATTTGTYKVVYAWNGFLQPINDTAHQVDQGVSIFKGGSTVPAKFQLKNAKGEVVQTGSATWTTPSAGAPTSAAITEEAYAATATTGGLYKYDTASQQYHYNWSTKGLKVGQYYRIGVTLDDGQTYSVSIGLR